MKNILVLGGTGFVGRHVCEKLHRLDWRITVPTRRAVNAAAVQHLPRLTVLEANVHDETTLARLLSGHDAVVNLVAILHGDEAAFERTHVELPAKLARACAATGVRRVVHVSALGAGLNGPSRYQRSKARGEEVLRRADLDLTILRPSVIFGAGDRFLSLFARLQTVFPVVPLAGAHARFQPVWVDDVADAVANSLLDPRTTGKTFECVGPEVMTLADLVRLAGRVSGHPRPVFAMPVALAHLQALAMEWLPGEPLMSTDNLRSMEVDNVASGQSPGLQDLGIQPAPVEAVAQRYLSDRGGRC